MKVLLSIVLISFSLNCLAATKWKMTSLEWPPFTGKLLPEGGAGIAILKEALKAEGVELEVEFVPWTRAINLAKEPGYVGYYPAWPEDVIEGFQKSDSIFKSPVGFVEPKDKPLVWEKLEDLKGKKIGTVQDYGNTQEFNALVKSGIILTEVVSDDATNVKKVAGSRIDGAFIDLYNLDWFLKNDLKDMQSKVQANKKTITEKNLHLAINLKSAEKNINETLKKGLSKIDAEKILKDYITKHLK